MQTRRFVRYLACGVLLLPILLSPSACIHYDPASRDEVPFLERAQTKADGGLTVTVAVPDREETKKLFGVNLYARRIQPVWIEIENREDVPFIFLVSSVDRLYYSPLEAARMGRYTSTRWIPSMGLLSIVFLPLIIPGWIESASASSANADMREYFLDEGISTSIIGPLDKISGYVFTTFDRGQKRVDVRLVTEDDERILSFVLPVPGELRQDYLGRDLESLYPPEEIEELDEVGLREYLKGLPAATTNKKGTREGDPINLAIIGEFDAIIDAFTHAGWDEAESIYLRSAWKTVHSTLFGSKYRESPVSSLYVFGRSQDIAFQLVRENTNERHHFRLWLTPKRFQGQPVWAGQASRDIGVKFTFYSSTLTTHVIDPEVDDERDFVITTLIEEGVAKQVGYLGGVGRVTKEEPRRNLTKDPYFTDGYRGIAVVASDPVPVQFFHWLAGEDELPEPGESEVPQEDDSPPPDPDR